ncbi:MAG: DUF4912 domain-containing protein [Treponema sp.]|jgi:hypothetical protein|nr:DUF4912 domain-containing protein [Treponema sp.]
MEESPHAPVSRPWLESLSTGELVKFADSCGIDIPPGLERIFIIEELLEYAASEGQEVKEEIEINPSYSESVALPKQYNISYIEVVIRDPLWIFVFWEIKGHDREIHENANDFNGYCLRVIPLNEGEAELARKENSFTVPVDVNDSARYLGFAERSLRAPGRYIVKLGVIRGDSELQIASSEPFYMPRLIEDDYIEEMSRNPLVRLSGVQNLSIIQSTDRQPRVKRQ